MTEPTPPADQQPVTPTRRDRLRPLELVGFSGVLALFTGVIVFYVIRGWDSENGWALTGIFAGSAFIVSLLVVALLGLGGTPSEEDQEARKDLHGPDGPDFH